MSTSENACLCTQPAAVQRICEALCETVTLRVHDYTQTPEYKQKTSEAIARVVDDLNNGRLSLS
ncbi:hypothetical protein D3C78_1615680 [compost metagenome]